MRLAQVCFFILCLFSKPLFAENRSATAPLSDVAPKELSQENLKRLFLVPEEPITKTLGADDKETLISVLKPIFENNDKKAKLAYGRNYRHLPPSIQFAFDLRFKNFSHALEVLKESRKSSDEKEIWESFVKAEPKDAVEGLCYLFKSNGTFPPESFEDERSRLIAWIGVLNEARNELQKNRKLSSYSQEINSKLSDLGCQDVKGILEKQCLLSDDQKKNLLTDSFFDLVRNAQRRSSYYVAANRKNDMKLALDPDAFNRVPLLSLYGGILSTPSPDRNRSHRRLRGIAKDMRPDSLERRIIAAVILEDFQDMAFTKRMLRFVYAYPFVSVINNLHTRLASCNLPEVKSWKPPR